MFLMQEKFNNLIDIVLNMFLDNTRLVCYIMCMKSRTNVSIEKSLLESARYHGLVLSSLLEESIINQLSKVKEIEWKEENTQNIAAYNSYINANGVFSDGMRYF